MFGMIAFLFITFGIGYFLICLIFNKDGMLLLLLKLSLSFPLGFGILSLLLYFWLLVWGSAEQPYILLEIGLLIVTGGAYFLRRCHRTVYPVLRQTYLYLYANLLTPYVFLLALLSLFFLISALSFVKFSLISPSGGWDAWAMWNMKARFIIASGTGWRSIFAQNLEWFHPDYPLLLPLSVVRGWLYMGVTSEVVPVIVALLFTLTIPALVWVGLSSINRYAGLLGCAFLLGSTRLLSHGTSQYADIPLSGYFLAVIILVYLSQLRDRSFLFAAGLFVGFSVWTKNEGLPLSIALFVSIIMWLTAKQARRRYFYNMLPMLLGMIIVLTGVFHFKLTLAPPNDIVAGQSWFATIDRLTDLGRYGMIWHHFTENLPILCGWQTSWMSDAFAWYVGFSILLAVLIKPSWSPFLTIPTLTALLLLLAYFAIYLITPKDLEWHLQHSLVRIMLHLLPLGAFIYFGFLGSIIRDYCGQPPKA